MGLSRRFPYPEPPKTIHYFAIEPDKHDAHKDAEHVKINDEFRNRMIRKKMIAYLKKSPGYDIVNIEKGKPEAAYPNNKCLT